MSVVCNSARKPFRLLRILHYQSGLRPAEILVVTCLFSDSAVQTLGWNSQAEKSSFPWVMFSSPKGATQSYAAEIGGATPSIQIRANWGRKVGSSPNAGSCLQPPSWAGLALLLWHGLGLGTGRLAKVACANLWNGTNILYGRFMTPRGQQKQPVLVYSTLQIALWGSSYKLQFKQCIIWLNINL